MKTLGRNVRWRRTALGLTQRQLADKIRVARRKPSQSFISKLESGRADIRLTTIRSLSRALRVPVWVLFHRPGEGRSMIESYLALAPKHKREVQRIIKWYLEGRQKP